jgi:hypothetical protein
MGIDEGSRAWLEGVAASGHCGPVCLIALDDETAETVYTALCWFIVSEHARPHHRAQLALLIELLAAAPAPPPPAAAPAPPPPGGSVAVIVSGFCVERLSLGIWKEVPDTRRADAAEAADLCRHFAREFPTTSYRVTERRWGRA